MKANPIRMAALVCVAFTSVFISYMAWEVNATLSGPGWCRTALGAEKVSGTDGTIKGLDACVGLLTIQLRSLAVNSHILFGVVALCLLVLIVIVVAGARLEMKASETGVQLNMSSSTDAAAAAAAGAQAATDAGTGAAQATTDAIKDAAP
jgi:hypothetical protein